MKREIKGITLIALVVTIVVLLILAGVSISILTGDSGIITQADRAKLATELSGYVEELEEYKKGKLYNNSKFIEESLTAGKTKLYYNTQEEGETGNIKTVIKSISDEYFEKLEIIKGELLINTKNKEEIKLAQSLGIQVNPYDITEDGELLSSEGNLLLMDENGTVTIPESVRKIGDGAFRGLEGLRTIIIPGTVKEIGNYAFSGNPTLENVIMEEGVEKIGDFAFQDCTALKEVDIADTVSIMGDTCFGWCRSLERFKFPNALNTIPNRALSSCVNLVEINIPEGVVNIRNAAFEYCSKIEEIYIPSTVNNIVGSAFQGMASLTNIKIATNNKSYSFSDNSLMSANGKVLYYMLSNKSEIVIPETVEELSSGALIDYSKSATLKITKNVKTISTVISGNITKIDVVSDNSYFKSDGGNLYNKDMTNLIKYCGNESVVNLPDTVKKINSYAFYGKKNVQKLTLPEAIEQLDGFSLESTQISELYLPKNVKAIYTSTFSGNTTVTISEDNPNYKTTDGTLILSKDGKRLVATSKNLAEYNIPSSVETIGGSAFYRRTAMKNIKIPSNVKTIENNAFDYSTTLAKVEITSSIKEIGTSAFSRCFSLVEIVIDKKENEISGAPWGCPYGLRAIKWKE